MKSENPKASTMKRNKKIYSLKHLALVIFCFVAIVFTSNIFAEKAVPETEFKYIRNSDLSRTLKYSVKYTKPDAKKSSEAVGVPVSFSTGTTKQKLATINTNSFGEAILTIPANQQLPSKNGQYTFGVSIGDNNLVEIAKDSVTLADIEIEMNLELKDSIKTILFQAHEINAKGEKIPVKTDVVFYVPRTFSKLKIAEASTSTDGKGDLEFPEGLPGDSIGNITIIAKIEDNAKYANVEKSQTIAWGVRTNYHIAKFKRALWTTIAPTWMIITLTILLLGVWGHYVFVIFKLFKIRKEGKTMAKD